MSNISGGEPSLGADDDRGGLEAVIRTVVVVGVMATAAAWVWLGPVAAFSVGCGAGLGVANLLILGRMVRAFLSKGGVSPPWVVAAILKLVVLLLAMYLPVRAGVFELLPFVFGFGALPLGIVASQFFSVRSSSKAN